MQDLEKDKEYWLKRKKRNFLFLHAVYFSAIAMYYLLDRYAEGMDWFISTIVWMTSCYLMSYWSYFRNHKSGINGILIQLDAILLARKMYERKQRRKSNERNKNKSK